jgi:hypothetical protein
MVRLNAPADNFWQSMQWQTAVATGCSVTSYVTLPHWQDPDAGIFIWVSSGLAPSREHYFYRIGVLFG